VRRPPTGVWGRAGDANCKPGPAHHRAVFFLPSEGKGYTLESFRARNDFTGAWLKLTVLCNYLANALSRR
jgi:hypothetical protein